MNIRTDVLPVDNPFQISFHVHIEDINRQVVFVTHGYCREVHNLQSACQNLIVGDVIELCSIRIFFRISRIGSNSEEKISFDDLYDIRVIG